MEYVEVKEIKAKARALYDILDTDIISEIICLELTRIITDTDWNDEVLGSMIDVHNQFCYPDSIIKRYDIEGGTK